MNEDNSLWGIDLGGTKIEGVVLNSADSPEILYRKRIATEAPKGYTHILQQILKLVNLMKSKTGLQPKRIGFGTPGILNPATNLMINCNSTVLNGKPLHNDLLKLLDLPVVIANDANCFALAETTMGIVKETNPKAQVVFGVIMGTGVGGGIVVNEKIVSGNMGNAGEWGHNFLDDSGGKCYCGKKGCVETIISGPALQKFYKSIKGDELTLQEIYNRYKNKEPEAEATISRLIHFFGVGISNIINILDPQVIVIGGGVGNIPELYTLGAEEARKYTFNSQFTTRIVPPKLGDSAGVFGAAYLAL